MATVNSNPTVTPNIVVMPFCTIPLTGVARAVWTPPATKPWGVAFEARIAMLGATVPGTALTIEFDPVMGGATGPPITGNAPAPIYGFSYLPLAAGVINTTLKSGIAAAVGDVFLDVAALTNMTRNCQVMIGAIDTNLTVYRFQTPSTWQDISAGGAEWQSTTIVAGDCVYFKGHATLPWNHIKHVYNQAAVGPNAAIVTIWEYSLGGGNWKALHDPTANPQLQYLTGDQSQWLAASGATPMNKRYDRGCLPTAAGTLYTGWQTPPDWAADTVNSVSGMWIRCRCVTGEAITTAPTTNAQYTGRLYDTSEWGKLVAIAASPVTLGQPLEFAHSGVSDEVHNAMCCPPIILPGHVPYNILIDNCGTTGTPVAAGVVAYTVDAIANI